MKGAPADVLPSLPWSELQKKKHPSLRASKKCRETAGKPAVLQLLGGEDRKFLTTPLQSTRRMKSKSTTNRTTDNKTSNSYESNPWGEYLEEGCVEDGGTLLRKKVASRGGKKTGANPEEGDEDKDCAGDNCLNAYLNKIGTVHLLSKAEEAGMGRQIRADFGALLAHLLRSGFVLEVLLDRTRVEMGYKTVGDERRARLGGYFEKGAALLGHARALYARRGTLGVEAVESLKSAFLELISELDFWQNIGGELLELLEEAFAKVENAAPRGWVASAQSGSWAAFQGANMMTHGEFEPFLKEAARLRGRAVQSRNRLMEANLRLVVSVAKKMGGKLLPLSELIQEGNLGLLLAAERFDERLGNRFSTFAVHLIRAKIKRENDNQGRTIRVPVHQCEAIRRLEKIRIHLESELGREVRPLELALESGLPLVEFNELATLRAGIVSLHQPLRSGEECPLEEVLPDPDSMTPFDQRVDFSGKLDPYLMGLGELERRVICCLYGLGGMPLLSAEETADVLGLGQAEIVRLRAKALDFMRSALASTEGLYTLAA